MFMHFDEENEENTKLEDAELKEVCFMGLWDGITFANLPSIILFEAVG